MPTAASNFCCGARNGISRRADPIARLRRVNPVLKLVRFAVTSTGQRRVWLGNISENWGDLGSGGCSAAGDWQTGHGLLVAEAGSARAMALDAGAAGCGRGLHGGGGGGDWRKDRRTLSPLHAWPLFPAHALLQFVFVGCGEELGWRGWLLPELMTRHRTIVAAAIVGAIRGPWHVFTLLSGFRIAAAFLFGVFGLSLLFTALWERVGGNVFVLAVAHASVNAPLQLLNRQDLSDAVFILYGLPGLAVLATAFWQPRLRVRAGSDTLRLCS